MISEKTVELNLSMELINHINFKNNLNVFAIAPSQRQEASVGYDVEIGNERIGNGILIQYKRAIPDKDEYLYHLNYTTYQNQHEILLRTENSGHCVFYAFPLFHTIDQISIFRRRLLVNTIWYKPSQITLPGGSIGKHILHINRKNLNAYVTSDPTNIGDSTSFNEMNDIFSSFKQNKFSQLIELMKSLNSSVSNERPTMQLQNRDDSNWGTLSQQFIIALSQNDGITNI